MIQAPAMVRLARRLMNGNRDLADIAEASWVVHPATKRIAPPAIYLPHHLERVTAVEQQTDWPTQLRKIRGGQTEHAATIAHRLRHAHLHQGYVYCGATKLTLDPAAEAHGLMINAPHVEDAALACTYVGNRYFGHAMSDDVPLNMLASETATAVRTAWPMTPHVTGYREIIGVDALALKSATFGRLTVFEDYGQNRGKQARYARMREKLLAGRKPSGAAGIHILRGRTGNLRLLANEEAIRARLSAIGFRAITPETMTAEEIIDAVADAPVVVGVEGSQWSHALYAMRTGGTMVVLQPPSRFNNIQKDRAECLDLHYAFVVGTPAEGGFEVDPDDILRVMELAQARPTTH